MEGVRCRVQGSWLGMGAGIYLGGEPQPEGEDFLAVSCLNLLQGVGCGVHGPVRGGEPPREWLQGPRGPRPRLPTPAKLRASVKPRH